MDKKKVVQSIDHLSAGIGKRLKKEKKKANISDLRMIRKEINELKDLL